MLRNHIHVPDLLTAPENPEDHPSFGEEAEKPDVDHSVPGCAQMIDPRSRIVVDEWGLCRLGQ